MNKKKNEKKGGLHITKREPGKADKTNYLQNLREFPSLQTHPVEDLIFPKENSVELVDSGKVGHPEFGKLDTQIPKSGHSNNYKLDTQNNATLGTQTIVNLDTQHYHTLDTQLQSDQTPRITTTGHPVDNFLDTHNLSSGHPDDQNLGVLAPKQGTQAPRKSEILGARTPKQKDSGHSKNANWRKYENTRSTVRVNLHIDREIDKKVRQYCMVDAPEKIELKEFYERAALTLLNNLDTQKQESLGVLAPYDDRRVMIASKSKPTIINLYLVYNSVFNPKTRWSVKDDEAGAKFNDSDFRLIELGIIQTHFNRAFRPGKINSFSYYINQIEEMLSMEFTNETIETMLKINRENWKKATKKEIDLTFLENSEADS